MISQLAYYSILGKPLILYFGILTLLSFLFTALIGFINYKGYKTIPFKWHPIMAGISITLAIIHAILGLASYL